MVVDTWSPTASMRTMKYLLENAYNHKARVQQFDSIGALLQANVKYRVFVKLYSRYGEYFTEYSNYFGRPLRLNKSLYGMTNSRNLFSYELTNWLIYEAGFHQSKCQMSVYYKYAPDGSKLVVLYYVYDCVYWYTSKELGKWFVDTLGNIFHVNFIVYAHWFMSIRNSQINDHSISVDQAIYATSFVASYLYTATIKRSSKCCNTNLPHYMIFTKEYASISDEQVEVLSIKYNIHYRSCMGSFIYLLSKRVDLCFAVHKLANS